MADPKIDIHQIYFQKQQRKILDPSFIPFDNVNNPKPKHREFYVFLQLFDQGALSRADYSGVFSWKFNQKTEIKGSQFVEFVKSNPGYDAYFVNPFWAEIVWDNLWEQGEYCHPGIVSYANEIFRRTGQNLDVSQVKNKINNLSYCNYWVGSRAFWKAFVEFSRPAYNELAKDVDGEGKGRFALGADRSIDAPYMPFVLERMFTTFLHFNPKWKAKAYAFDEKLLNNRYGATHVHSIQYYIDHEDDPNVQRYKYLFRDQLLRRREMREILHQTIHPKVLVKKGIKSALKNLGLR